MAVLFLHNGHVQYLNEARSLGDRLIVGQFNASIKRLKGSERLTQRPIVSLFLKILKQLMR